MVKVSIEKANIAAESKRSPSKSPKSDSIVIRELKELYATRLLPIEKQYLFSKLHYPEILDAELSAKPTVLLIGQYSTGKTSFIRHLLGMDYPEIHIGPEVLYELLVFYIPIRMAFIIGYKTRLIHTSFLSSQIHYPVYCTIHTTMCSHSTFSRFDFIASANNR
jgi:hypothetical protein